MFSALLTAMLGAFWLDRLGVLELDLVYLPETFVLPQAVGGVLFGVGFLVGGPVPGHVVRRGRRPAGSTASASSAACCSASGSFNAAFEWIEPLYSTTPLGAVRLTDLAGVSRGAGVAGVTAVALAGSRWPAASSEAAGDATPRRAGARGRGRWPAAAGAADLASPRRSPTPARDRAGVHHRRPTWPTASWRRRRRCGSSICARPRPIEQFHIPTAVHAAPARSGRRAARPGGPTWSCYGDDRTGSRRRGAALLRTAAAVERARAPGGHLRVARARARAAAGGGRHAGGARASSSAPRR